MNNSRKKDQALFKRLLVQPIAFSAALGPDEAGLFDLPGAPEAFQDAGRKWLLIRRLIAGRKSLGMSQSDIADQMGTTQSAVSDIEKGTTDPRLSTLQRFARAIGGELHVALWSSSWTQSNSWLQRTIGYPNSVKPVRIEVGLEDLWLAVIDRSSPEILADLFNSSVTIQVWDCCYGDAAATPSRVAPVRARDPRDDNYITPDDLGRMNLVESVNAKSSSD